MLRRLGQLRQNLRNAAQPNLINYQETKVTELANGLRIATEDMGGRTATIGLWIDCGTRYEKLNEMGTAHFFEHLVFKVTLETFVLFFLGNLEANLKPLTGHFQASFKFVLNSVGTCWK